MKNISLKKILARSISLSLIAVLTTSTVHAQDKPNVIVIMADDLGYDGV